MSPGPWYHTPAYLAARRHVAAHHPPCYYCGIPSDTVEHLIPVALGGGDEDLVPACRPCNIKRGAKLGNAIMRANKRAREAAGASRFFVGQHHDPPSSPPISLASHLPRGSANPSRNW